MKSIIWFLIGVLMLNSCSSGDDKDTVGNPEAKQQMRDFVIGISQYAKTINPKFNIIPQNGIELVSKDGENTSEGNVEYLNAIDANGQEDLFYGYDNDDQKTPAATTSYLKAFLNLFKKSGKKILVTDYCSTVSKMNDSYLQNKNAGYVSFAASKRELNIIPNIPVTINEENNAVVTTMSQVKNFLYLINPDNFTTKADFINAVTATNYDLIIMDFFFHDGSEFTAAEVNQLRNKANGGKRLVVSYMSIGEAESYRYYWQSSWNTNKPDWMDAENPDWAGNFKVKYWNPDWQKIIYGNDNSYLKKILNAGFDGAYLDIIDAFEFYE